MRGRSLAAHDRASGLGPRRSLARAAPARRRRVMTLSVAVRARLGAFDLDAAFEAPPGVTALFGRSGAGKTSIVKAVAGLIRPDHARILLDGAVLEDGARRLPPHRRRIGLVFQDARLFPHLSVAANLRFGARFAPRGATTPEAPADTPTSRTFDEVVALLGLASLLSRRPRALSGGEAQRVALGRALLASPRLLLMDEPLASLDEARKAEILPYIETLRDEARIPILYVSHSLPEIARLATTVVALSAGRVVASGPAAEVLSDVAAFPILGRQQAGAILPARVVRHDDDGLTQLAVSAGPLWVPRIDAPPGAVLRLRIRARDVTLATQRPQHLSALNILEGKVEEIAPAEDGRDAAMAEVALRCGTDRIRARVTRRSLQALGLEPGARAWAVAKAVAVSRRDVGAFEDREG
jgi:molybdate transport system ATP-binding protein